MLLSSSPLQAHATGDSRLVVHREPERVAISEMVKTRRTRGLVVRRGAVSIVLFRWR